MTEIQKIQKVCVELKINQHKMCKEICINHSTLCRYYKGEIKNPSYRIVVKLMEYVGLIK